MTVVGLAPVCPDCRTHMTVYFRTIRGPSPSDVRPTYAECEDCELGWRASSGTFDLDAENGGIA